MEGRGKPRSRSNRHGRAKGCKKNSRRSGDSVGSEGEEELKDIASWVGSCVGFELAGNGKSEITCLKIRTSERPRIFVKDSFRGAKV